ncbi:signal recognition particle-docking protein FtsY [Acidimicrobiales bacterium]|nr:signal recognition particle-docking protein FtsY [bacterium]MDC1388511.1 signal recognition particle-docking protein FtsY [Acidimicrobiales bacterium]
MNALVLIVIIVAALVLVGAGLFFFRRQNVAVDTPSLPAVAATDTKEVEAKADSDVLVQDAPDAERVDVDTAPVVDEPEPEPEPEPLAKATFRDRLAGVLGGLRGRSIDEDAWEELEEALILADVGVPTTMAILDRVRDRAKEEKAKDFDDALALLRNEMEIELGDTDISLAVEGEPAIWMFVGVNGVGKTTTIGKLAKREADAGRTLVLAAGDTFRAAAAEQLETWAERSDAGFVRGAEGADPGSVVFDAVEHAAAINADLVLADTAGRLHNKTNLMEELRKVRRVAEKAKGQVSEVLLVIDATTGQNGLVQAKQFTEAVEVTGIVLTKLDGSAKGGIVLAIQKELGIPIKLVGLGEGIDDLVEFDAHEFVDALFA